MKATVKSILAAVLILAMAEPCLATPIPLEKRKNIVKRSLSIGMLTAISADFDGQSKTLTLSFYGNFGETLVTIEDLEGNVVLHDAVEANSHEYIIEMEDLSEGEYKLSISTGGDSFEGFFYVDEN
ncbi:MAG: DUF3244 domain-containing protein [Tannerella sp.]|jgi:hypothetical protein|nr:DUF3244 domain-containing protein [Tannerella sp.]